MQVKKMSGKYKSLIIWTFGEYVVEKLHTGYLIIVSFRGMPVDQAGDLQHL